MRMGLDQNIVDKLYTMKTKLGIIAVLFVVTGFGMIHGGSILMERIAIGLMGIGIIYLLYLLLTTSGDKKENEE